MFGKILLICMAACTFVGCGAANNSSSSSSSGQSTYCSNAFLIASRNLSTSSSGYVGGPVHALSLVLDHNNLTTIGGDLENPQYADYNSDPLYVYSGSGSAHVKSLPFYAQLTTGSLVANTLNFWIYSVAEGPQEYVVKINSWNFICGGAGGDYGASYGARFFEQKIVVQPHHWQLASLRVGSDMGNQDIRIEIRRGDPSTDMTSDFYLDDIQFENSVNTH